jgi:fructose-specific phosphotransferase system IIB component
LGLLRSASAKKCYARRGGRSEAASRHEREEELKIVAVTACPTGVAHTYMAAEQLERAAKALGHEIKVETQGQIGIENRLSSADIAAAEAAIFAVGIQVEERERFDGKRIIEVPVAQAIKDPQAVLARLGG